MPFVEECIILIECKVKNMEKRFRLKKCIYIIDAYKNLIKILLVFILIVFNPLQFRCGTAYASNTNCQVIYFYSTTCSECSETSSFFEQYEGSEKIAVEKMNVYEADNIDLLAAYCELYDVVEDEANNVPIVFIGDSYLFGSKNIKENFSSLLQKENYENAKSVEEVKKSSAYGNNESKADLFKLCTSALVNSLNPCSFSMMLFLLLTLTSRKSKNIFRIGMAFCIGKIITFIAIGTILFRSFAYIENTKLMHTVNVVLVIIYAWLLIENLYDFINIIKKEKRVFCTLGR